MSKWRALVPFFLSIYLAGCQEQAVTQQEKEPTPVASEQAVPSEGEKTKSLFLDKLRPGMNEEEITNLFGRDFSLVENVMEGTETWRYDRGKTGSYTFDDQGIDKVDLEGLKAGHIEAQMFIDWTEEGLVTSAALYLKEVEQEGRYREYHLEEDGSMEEIEKTFD